MKFFTQDHKEPPVSSSAPRVTTEGIEQKIRSTVYTRLPDSTTTMCQITMENGFVLLGTSACVSPENFDEEIGKAISYDNAFRQIWALEGYLLAQQRHEAVNSPIELKPVARASEEASGVFGFDVALRRIRGGERCARGGWNGKDMWVTLVPAFGFRIDDMEMLDCLGLKTVRDQLQLGWLASQTDMLADDWFVVRS